MFTKVLSAVCWPSDDAGLVVDVSLLVSEELYLVRYLSGTKCFVVSNGSLSPTVPDVVLPGPQRKVSWTASTAARSILVRELKRRGLTRQPKSEFVTILATVVHEAIKDALASTPACGCNELQFAGCDH
jgi:hypothetical protein